MSNDAFDIGDRALYDRLMAAGKAASTPRAEPENGQDLMDLAVWLERRAAGGQPHDPESDLTQAVEAMLFEDPDLLDDMLALTPPVPSDMVSPHFLTRAQALVPAVARQENAAVVVPFRLGRTRAVGQAKPRNVWLAWSALAACLAFIAVLGYDMGTVAGYDLYPTTDHEMSIDILDAPNAAIDGTS